MSSNITAFEYVFFHQDIFNFFNYDLTLITYFNNMTYDNLNKNNLDKAQTKAQTKAQPKAQTKAQQRQETRRISKW